MSEMMELQDEFQIEERLAARLGRVHARQRLGIELAHEAQIFGQGLNFFHIENWYSVHSMIRNALRLSGLHGRGIRNAADVELRINPVRSEKLPKEFDGFRVLHLSDLHTDMSKEAMARMQELLCNIGYDICVITGDFRAKTFGPFEPCLRALRPIVDDLRGPIYGVLGNHDTVRMLPALEDMGVRMLMNECHTLKRGAARLHLAGIDDAHYYRVDNIEKAAAEIGEHEYSILLSHTPETYRQAAHAGFDLFLCGHTHGGQICLPGGIPITLDSVLPRKYGSGAWRYHQMVGYTSVGAGSSVVPVRLNCRPEITVHELISKGGP